MIWRDRGLWVVFDMFGKWLEHRVSIGDDLVTVQRWGRDEL